MGWGLFDYLQTSEREYNLQRKVKTVTVSAQYITLGLAGMLFIGGSCKTGLLLGVLAAYMEKIVAASLKNDASTQSVAEYLEKNYSALTLLALNPSKIVKTADNTIKRNFR